MEIASQSGGAPSEVAMLDTCLLWIRRDIRCTDNPALSAAVQLARRVIPVYIWAPEEEGQFQPGRCSRWWLHQSLGGLEADLQALGSSLVYRRAKESRAALIELVQETGAQALVFNHLYDPISLVRDNEVKTAMQEMKVHCQSFNGDVLYEPWEVLTESGHPFVCFQDFWDRLASMEYPPREILQVPDHLPPVPHDLLSLSRQGLGLMTPEEEESNEQLYHSWNPGGKGAFMALENFVQERLPVFSQNKAKTDRGSTSCLSPHIHFGELSIRFVYYVVKQRELQDTSQRSSCTEYLRQMAFREYSRYLSFHFPFTHERSLLEHLRAAPWKFNHRHFKGNTGYPMVDASMRQLWSTGWLHNRSRVICASFLVKNLLLPWQWGLKHFWDCLLDADLECDALGWQYCSGCLADAHPFDFMLNHIVEAKRYDPDGNYVRRWLPALARLPTKWIHKPWEAPEQVLSDAGVELGVTYPYPLISLAESEEHLQQAAAVIQETLAASNPGSQIPYRPASMPSANGLNLTSVPPSPDRLVHPKRLQPGASKMDGTQGATELAGRLKRGAAEALAQEEEEVVSNLPGTAAPTVNSANQECGTAAAAAAAALQESQQEARQPPSDDDAAAVVPSISLRGPAQREASMAEGVLANGGADAGADGGVEGQMSGSEGEEAASRPQKRANMQKQVL